MEERKITVSRLTRLVESLDEELEVLETSHKLQFDSKASLHDKLVASQRAKSALTKSRRLCNELAESLLMLSK